MGTSLLDADNLTGAAFLERYPQGVPWQGISAELITARWNLGRAELDITATLVHALRERRARYGLQTMCESGGQANAMVVEALY